MVAVAILLFKFELDFVDFYYPLKQSHCSPFPLIRPCCYARVCSVLINRYAQPFRTAAILLFKLELDFFKLYHYLSFPLNSAVAVPFLVKYLPAFFERDALPFRIHVAAVLLFKLELDF